MRVLIVWKVRQLRLFLFSDNRLDEPILVQFFRYIVNMLKGDFGVSYSIAKNTEITLLLSTKLPISLRIGGQAVLLGTLVGLVLGIAAALKHNTWVDTLCTIISVLGVSLPSYVCSFVKEFRISRSSELSF